MKVIHHYGLSNEDKRAIMAELSKPDWTGDRYNHIVDIPADIGITHDDDWLVYAKVYINTDDDLDNLSIDEVISRYTITVRLDGLDIDNAKKILEEYNLGSRAVEQDGVFGRFDIYIDERCPVYYDILKAYMIDSGYDWKWGEPSKCGIEYV